MACFLVQEGGDIYSQNGRGQSTLQVYPTEMAIVVATYAETLRYLYIVAYVVIMNLMHKAYAQDLFFV